jgi:sugar O-acyltransferase (sialic acid O-acetyltransferase NeuD family)
MSQSKLSMGGINKEKLYLYGASGHGKVVAEIVEALDFEIVGFVDDDSKLTSVWNYPVHNAIPEDAQSMVLSLGNNLIRKKLAEKHLSFNHPVLIHPKSNLSSRTQIEEGTVVMAGVTVNADVYIGKHCILNTNSSIDHDGEISDYVHISPNAALAGNVKVEEGAHIGMGASIIQGIHIGKWSIVGAGAVVIEDVPDFAVVVGNPAKVLKYQSDILSSEELNH